MSEIDLTTAMKEVVKYVLQWEAEDDAAIAAELAAEEKLGRRLVNVKCVTAHYEDGEECGEYIAGEWIQDYRTGERLTPTLAMDEMEAAWQENWLNVEQIIYMREGSKLERGDIPEELLLAIHEVVWSDPGWYDWAHRAV